MPEVKYAGGIRDISVVLPDRTLDATVGNTFTVSDDEAARLLELPGWEPVATKTKPAAKASTPKDND